MTIKEYNDSIVKLADGTVVIPQCVYDDTHDDFKGVWTSERWDWDNWEEVKHQYMGKRTWMPPAWVNGTTCLLVEGMKFTILPDEVFNEQFRKAI